MGSLNGEDGFSLIFCLNLEIALIVLENVMKIIVSYSYISWTCTTEVELAYSPFHCFFVDLCNFSNIFLRITVSQTMLQPFIVVSRLLIPPSKILTPQVNSYGRDSLRQPRYSYFFLLKSNHVNL